MESWAGINRYYMLAALIRPEHAAPDERSVAFLQEHGDGNLRGFDFVMRTVNPPAIAAPRAPPHRRRSIGWASRVALSAALDRPADAGRVLLAPPQEATRRWTHWTGTSS